MPEYRIRFTEDHLVEMASRYRKQSYARLWLSPIKLLCFLGLAALFAITAYNFILVPSVVVGVFLLLLAVGPRIDYWLMRRRFRSSPFYDCEMHISLSTDGLTSTDPKTRLELKWSAFTKAYRFVDGFLLFSGPQIAYWWPDSALSDGTIADVERLLRDHVPEYRGA